jgi:hypothetical protein
VGIAGKAQEAGSTKRLTRPRGKPELLLGSPSRAAIKTAWTFMNRVQVAIAGSPTINLTTTNDVGSHPFRRVGWH